MGRDTIESLSEIIADLQMAIQAHDYSKIQLLLRELQEYIDVHPTSASKELLETLEYIEQQLKKEKDEVVAKMGDLQNLKKYSS